MNAAGVLGQYGFSTLFGFGPALDSKNPSMTIAQLSQGGIALPDPSLYLSCYTYYKRLGFFLIATDIQTQTLCRCTQLT